MSAEAANKQTAEKKASKPTPKSGSKKTLDSTVEQYFLDLSGRKLSYTPVERLPIIEVSNFPDLGRMTALRFIEWVQQNPNGVVSLPTGKTPEYFIRWTTHYVSNWHDAEVIKELKSFGIDTSIKPNFHGLHFVQIDEFYPIDPSQRNSFHYYVRTQYLRGFGLDPNKAMLIDPTSIGIPDGMTITSVFPDGKVDLGLRHRNPTSKQEELQREVILTVDQFCSNYEKRIRQLGGIGFFLGGIGPDGHIGFNPRGAHFYSPTRLTYTNYETEAAAATDLGGIEVSRGKPVITIGLGTITYNPDAVVLVFAAGEGKSTVVANAVQNEPNVLYPSSSLQGMKNARFYLTTGATVDLTERCVEDVLKSEKLDQEQVEKAVMNCALDLNIRLDQLQSKHVDNDRILKHVVNKTGMSLPQLALAARHSIIKKMDRGMDDLENETILHTGPHHDDIMLAYMPYIMHLVRVHTNKNYFNVLTSGFTAVTNKFLADIFRDCIRFLDEGVYNQDLRDGAFYPDNEPARAEEVYRFLGGIASTSEDERSSAQARRMIFNLMQVYADEDFHNIKDRLKENLHYLETLYPGKKDIEIIQKLKGMQREYEEELIWGFLGTSPKDVFHSRLGFYTGDIFTQNPTHDRDVKPVLSLLEKLNPTCVTLAFDPEGAGPDTHYKVLQVLHEALHEYQKITGNAPKIWGYRNVWFKFHPAESNVFVPASLNTMASMTDSFMNCFGSQKHASFPSYEYDGPFCEQAEALWVKQYRMLRTCLGERFFTENPNPRLRSAAGFVFFKEMTLDEFSGKARRLAAAAEAI